MGLGKCRKRFGMPSRFRGKKAKPRVYAIALVADLANADVHVRGTIRDLIANYTKIENSQVRVIADMKTTVRPRPVTHGCICINHGYGTTCGNCGEYTPYPSYKKARK